MTSNSMRAPIPNRIRSRGRGAQSGLMVLLMANGAYGASAYRWVLLVCVHVGCWLVGLHGACAMCPNTRTDPGPSALSSAMFTIACTRRTAILQTSQSTPGLCIRLRAGAVCAQSTNGDWHAYGLSVIIAARAHPFPKTARARRSRPRRS